MLGETGSTTVVFRVRGRSEESKVEGTDVGSLRPLKGRRYSTPEPGGITEEHVACR